MKSLWKLVLVCGAVALESRPGRAEIVIGSKCYPEALACTLGAGGCVAAPTSLRPIEDDASATGDGWVRGSKCGKDRAGSNCGKYLGKAVCDDGGTGCDCGGGMGPCTEAVPGSEAKSLKVIPSPSTGAEAPETPALRERLRTIVKGGLPAELFAFVRGLAALESLHLQAEVEIWRTEKVGGRERETWGAASYESWEAGERFRFMAPVPSDLGMSQFAEVAFDGRRFQMYLRDSTLVTVSTTDSRVYMPPLRSPLALMAFYLTPLDEGVCNLCELRLADVRAVGPDAVKSELSAEGSLLSTPPTHWGTALATGFRLQYRPARRGVISTIKQVDRKGQVLSRVRLSNFNPVPGHADLLFPWTIVYEILDERGKKPILRETYRVGLVEADRPIPDAVFHLSTAGGRHVWDDDNRVHVQ